MKPPRFPRLAIRRAGAAALLTRPPCGRRRGLLSPPPGLAHPPPSPIPPPLSPRTTARCALPPILAERLAKRSSRPADVRAGRTRAPEVISTYKTSPTRAVAHRGGRTSSMCCRLFIRHRAAIDRRCVFKIMRAPGGVRRLETPFKDSRSGGLCEARVSMR